jgi:acetoin utilization deacetylase AcuC-like enzyme
MNTKIIYSNKYNRHNAPDHPENSERLNAMIKQVRALPFLDEIIFEEPKMIHEKSIYNVHSNEMIDLIKKISIIGMKWIEFDTYVCLNDYETARLASGALSKICHDILNGKCQNGYALVRPPGHHATKHRSMGFCLFNNAAIAANELALKRKRILIVDFDVHHGNGTQEIFYDRKDVMYQSFHLYPHYPGTGDINEIGISKGEGYTINAPLNYGDGDKIALRILEEVFLPIGKQYSPDIIIMSAGYDSHHQDPLGGLKFTTDFFKIIIEKYQEIQEKIACTLEGGYNLEWIGKCLISQLAQLTKNKIEINDFSTQNEYKNYLIKRLKDKFASYWRI